MPLAHEIPDDEWLVPDEWTKAEIEELIYAWSFTGVYTTDDGRKRLTFLHESTESRCRVTVGAAESLVESFYVLDVDGTDQEVYEHYDYATDALLGAARAMEAFHLGWRVGGRGGSR